MESRKRARKDAQGSGAAASSSSGSAPAAAGGGGPSWHSALGAEVHADLGFGATPHGLGGVALRAIAPSAAPGGAATVLCSLPYSSVLSEAYARAQPRGAAARALLGALRPAECTGRALLYLQMVAERGAPAAGADADTASPGPAFAPFRRYLRSLPSVFDDPAWWPEAEVRSLLAGTNLQHGALLRRAWLRRIFDALVPPLVAARPDLFPSRDFTFEAFLWAHSAFSSRGFPHVLSVRPGEEEAAAAAVAAAAAAVAAAAAAGPAVSESALAPLSAPAPAPAASAAAAAADVLADGPNPFQHPPHVPVGCMLPVLDILNHRPRTPIAWLRLADRVAFACEPGFAGVPAGAEVFNNYGAKSNEELLLGFGFVLAEPRNEHDTLSLAVAPIAAPALSQAGGRNGVAEATAADAGADADEREEQARTREARDNLAFLISAAELPSRFVCRRAPASEAGAEDAAVGSVEGESPALPAELLMLMRAGSLCRLQLALAAGACRAGGGSPRAAARALLSQSLSASIEERALGQLRELFAQKLAALELAQPWLRSGEGEGGAGAAAVALLAAAPSAAWRVLGPGELDGAGSATIDSGATAAAPVASPAAAAADPQRAEYRRWMARVYVRGQHEILLDALAALNVRLRPERLAALRCVLPAGACALEVAPGAAGLPARVFAVGGGDKEGDEAEGAPLQCAECAEEDEGEEAVGDEEGE